MLYLNLSSTEEIKIMCRELTPWKFVINCLFFADKPLNINKEFWEYMYVASNEIKAKIKDIENYYDHYSVEAIIWHDPLFFSLNKKEETIELNKSTVDKNFLDTVVNYSIDDEIKQALPILIANAYETFKYHELKQ